jgi:hypothetical protein
MRPEALWATEDYLLRLRYGTTQATFRAGAKPTGTTATSFMDAILDLPRFRGGLRAWDQGIWSEGILLSCLVPFFCSAPGGAILPFSNRRH